jgi:hypothetical protein
VAKIDDEYSTHAHNSSVESGNCSNFHDVSTGIVKSTSQFPGKHYPMSSIIPE